ncbi:ENTH domain-containing protein [Mycena indigotica]|uniref:ENTH domain-containing protein n=1 Tax=Mycena indigotica TaxID=2126181 RepID=A0A8H6VVN6_9AGAR|nr:ENTH domain-containing protein [Mycena indigotica]KAF7289959.1 ENTH domain-containing protein [Mycena indigotica]
MQHFGKGAVRVVKNYTKGYSDTQAKVREATSNDPWGPSGTQMNEIAQMTYNQGDFVEIMEMLDKRLNDKGKNWRHVFKSLTLLDYLLHQGSENVIIYFKDNLYVIKTLKEFQYIDEDGKDQGGNVRAKAKDITSLLQDESRLRNERRARASMRERMVRGAEGEGEFDDAARAVDENGRRRGTYDDDMQKAIEASKQSLRQEQLTKEEQDLQEAIKLSKQEEDNRQQSMEESNAKSLFDDQQQLQPASNNPFPFLNAPPQQQQQQLQPQFTAIQPQFTAFNPYQQQAQLEAEYLLQQQQQQAFLQQQQQEEWMRQQMLIQQQQQQQAQQEEWMRQQMMQQQQQQQLAPQPTGFGSNNPFALSQQPPMPSFVQQPQPPTFNLPGTYENSTSPPPQMTSSPAPSNQQHSPQPGGAGFKVKVNDGNNQHLANLFANREDGQDTFGNVGALRYGHTNAGRAMVANQGPNPFARPQQQTQQNEQPFFSV